MFSFFFFFSFLRLCLVHIFFHVRHRPTRLRRGLFPHYFFFPQVAFSFPGKLMGSEMSRPTSCPLSCPFRRSCWRSRPFVPGWRTRDGQRTRCYCHCLSCRLASCRLVSCCCFQTGTRRRQGEISLRLDAAGGERWGWSWDDAWHVCWKEKKKKIDS